MTGAYFQDFLDFEDKVKGRKSFLVVVLLWRRRRPQVVGVMNRVPSSHERQSIASFLLLLFFRIRVTRTCVYPVSRRRLRRCMVSIFCTGKREGSKALEWGLNIILHFTALAHPRSSRNPSPKRVWASNVDEELWINKIVLQPLLHSSSYVLTWAARLHFHPPFFSLHRESGQREEEEKGPAAAAAGGGSALLFSLAF